jgi:hypothetical protein
MAQQIISAKAQRFHNPVGFFRRKADYSNEAEEMANMEQSTWIKKVQVFSI